VSSVRFHIAEEYALRRSSLCDQSVGLARLFVLTLQIFCTSGGSTFSSVSSVQLLGARNGH